MFSVVTLKNKLQEKSCKEKRREMSNCKAGEELETIAKLECEDEQRLEMLLKGTRDRIDVKRIDPPPGFGAAASQTRKHSLESDETESPTPDFEFTGAAGTQFSICTMPNQSLKRSSPQEQCAHDEIDIHSAPTQISIPNFRLFDERTVIDNDVLAEISNGRRVNRVIPYIVQSEDSGTLTPSSMLTQLNTEEENLHSDFNGNFVSKKASVSSRSTESPKLSLSNSAKLEFSGTNSKENPLLFDTVDIDELTQLSTPNMDVTYFSIGTNLSRLPISLVSSNSQDKNIYRSCYGYREKPDFLTLEDKEEIISNNLCSRKRKSRGQASFSYEDKENNCENIRNISDASTLVSLTQQLNLSCNKKRRRLSESSHNNARLLDHREKLKDVGDRGFNFGKNIEKSATTGLSVTLVNGFEKCSLRSTNPWSTDVKPSVSTQGACSSRDIEESLVLSSVSVTSIDSGLLSDRCCEYDKIISNENLLVAELGEDSFNKINFIAGFKVPEVLIHKQVDAILTFLDKHIDGI